jgi:hypothetical protein
MVSVCCLVAVGVSVTSAAESVCGYFGDRSGVYRDANPPTRWAEDTNVLWKTPVPNLGSAAPVVAGDRVFVLSEPGWTNDLPLISCYSTDNGILLWEREMDPLLLTVQDEAERQKIREHWRKHLAWIRDYYLLFHDYSANKEDPGVKRRMEEMGVLSWGQNYLYGKFNETNLSDYAMSRFGRKFPQVGKAGIGMDTWRCMGSHDQMWIGEVFGTPVTDGRSLYVATAWGFYAAYDMDGRLRWMRFLSPERPHDYCSVARSPILYGDVVVSDLGRMVRAFDRSTGELKWERRRQGGVHEFVSPVVLRVGTQDVLWFAWPKAASRDWCFSYSSPFVVTGDRIYIRSLDHLYCIAGKDPAPAAPSGDPEALMAEAEKGKDVWGALAALGPSARTVAPRIEALLAKHGEPWKPFGALAAIDVEAARRQREALVKAMVGSNLSDHLTPRIGELLYDLGPISRELLAPIEAKVDERMYPINGPRHAQDLLTALYRRSGEAGFAEVHVHPMPWLGGPQAGKEVRLTWKALNATRVRIEPGVGDVPGQGEHKFILDQPLTFTFTADGPGGPSVRKVTVKPPAPKQP